MAVSDWVLGGIELRPFAISDCPLLPITQQEVISSMPGVLTPAASPIWKQDANECTLGILDREWQEAADISISLSRKQQAF
ncbi:uncharacterized [Tachysurus ichikawai]